MKFEITAFANGAAIPTEYAFCIPDAESTVTMGPNKSPQVKWSELPENTQSLVLVCHDKDVPSVADDVNQEGKTIPADLPRIDFYHWLLINIPPHLGELKEAEDSDGVIAKGKDFGAVVYGARGINDYTKWFGDDADMGGKYGGYDGPCPPWNDDIVHHYVFTLYALDIETLQLSEEFHGPDVIAALEGHVLEKAEWVGTYTLNPNLR